MTLVKFTDVAKYYKGLPHQKNAVNFLGDLLLNTPAAGKLGLEDSEDWLALEVDELEWLQRQISNPTLQKFTDIWRKKNIITPKRFNQRDNPIKPYVTCNSSAHAMVADFYLRRGGRPGLTDDADWVRKVFSGNYGGRGKSNPSVIWDVQKAVAKSYKVNLQWQWNSDYMGLLEELDGGVSAINIWHKGSRPNNKRGGHVIMAVDKTSKGILVHDPFGSRPPYYKDTKNGIYTIGFDEFKWRWQGAWTKFKGLI